MRTIAIIANRLADAVEHWRKGTAGATAAEYALLVALVFAVIILAVKVFGHSIGELLGRYPDLTTAS